MSYCVNCGVKLDSSAAQCPLCETPVLNPRHRFDADAPPPYPPHKNELPSINRNFASSIVTVVLALPAIVLLIINMAYSAYGPWCLYPIGALSLLWIYITPPLLMPKPRVSLLLAINGTATALYLLLIERLSGAHGWFFPLALPLTALATVLIILLRLGTVYRQWRKLKIAAMCLWALCLLLIGIEVTVDLYVSQHIFLTWSLIAAVSLAGLGLLLQLIARNQRITNELMKKLHM